MMDQKKWKQLFNAFNEEDNFDEEGYANDSEFEDMDLMDWLDCDSRGPSMQMMHEFSLHGYDVFPVEKDSFGWLIGGVRHMLIPNSRIITFG